VSNYYIQYVIFILAVVRVSRIFLDDGIFRPIRDRLLYRNSVNGHSVDKENLTYEKKIMQGKEIVSFDEPYPKPGKAVVFFREQFSCQWCLPFWVTVVMLGALLVFPIVITWIYLFFASSFIVSVLYSKYA